MVDIWPFSSMRQLLADHCCLAAQAMLMRIGMSLLLTLMVVVMFFDVNRLIG